MKSFLCGCWYVQGCRKQFWFGPEEDLGIASKHVFCKSKKFKLGMHQPKAGAHEIVFVRMLVCAGVSEAILVWSGRRSGDCQ